ncbi:MAG: cobyric acid synthase [Methanospirillaceae archaeon]|nr:cobyric acid synthase [Methanospirillaceae archaeon]
MSLMVLGTASHVGKSTLVAAICRILYRQGISCAPFKSQNMSLNSYVTQEGSEIGIAQAMQAMSAGLVPDARMNPILLKPKGDQKSQIILMGKPYRDTAAREYYQETDELLSVALSAAGNLREQYGHLIIEGAGGAAELNLYDRDIANIRLAQNLRVPIILVADIERGGVFAQAYGTIMLLPPDVRPLLAGLVVNKFRGDPDLFTEGIAILEDICNLPVLGVIPYTDFSIPSEDSLSLGDKISRDLPIQIAIIKIPHISNFTDFELLERYARVRYTNLSESLLPYDAIIIPGTKNTISDMQALLTSRAYKEILAANARGVPVIGICGGYQMLCREIFDSGVEEKEGRYKGLGLLSCTTKFTGYHKTTVQVTRTPQKHGPILSTMNEVTGYEIHMGTTDTTQVHPAFAGEGAVSNDGLVIGTYMHGLFLNPTAINALLTYLAEKKGMTFNQIPDDAGTYGFEHLADHVTAHLDIPYLTRIITGEEKNPA